MREYRVMIGEGSVFGLGSPVTAFGVSVIAYREMNGAITESSGRVLIPCDEARYRELSKQMSSYSIVKIMARLEDATFHVEQLLEVGAQPLEDEKIFFEQQALPVTFVSQFGEFQLNKQIDWFEGEISYQGRKIRVNLDKKENVETLQVIYKELDKFLESAGRYAARELLELGNDWCEDAWLDDAPEGEQYSPMTADDFVQRINLNSISIAEDESYTLWYDDGDIFWGHAICVDGNLKSGFTNASMQG